MKTNSNFWIQLETKQISKESLPAYLITKLGSPTNPTQTNLLSEILKKVNAYYFTTEPTNSTIYQLIGTITKPEQIVEKQRKEGKNRGQTYYNLKITTEDGEDKLQALPENLEPSKLNQIKQLAILNQNLVFKYKKWITNKQLLDFYPVAKIQAKTKAKPKKQPC
jgi:hypothetical protein